MKAILSSVLLIFSCNIVAAQQIADQFTGVWNLVVIERVGANGEAVPLRRPYSEGQLIYTEGGHFAVQLSRPDRQTFAGEEPTMEEAAAAFADYGARYGTFTVNEAESTITHHQQNNQALPTPESVDMTYNYEFADNRLMWSRRPPINNDPSYRFSGIEMIQTYIFERAE